MSFPVIDEVPDAHGQGRVDRGVRATALGVLGDLETKAPPHALQGWGSPSRVSLRGEGQPPATAFRFSPPFIAVQQLSVWLTLLWEFLKLNI